LTKRTVLIIVLTPFVLILLLVGGFFVYNTLSGQHAENTEQFAEFGFKVLPTSRFEESVGLLGAKQLPPTFGEEKLTPAQRVIRGLIRDNERLIEDKKLLQSEIDDLKAQVTDLREYRRLNEHFAPSSITQQLAAVEQQMINLLQNSNDARRFNTLEQQAMAASVKQKYHDVIRNRSIIFNDAEREQFVAQELAVYAFCVGDGIQIAANSSEETRQIAAFMGDTENAPPLKPQLQQDLNTVLQPCQRQLELSLTNFRQPG